MEEVKKWKVIASSAYRWAEKKAFMKPGQVFSAKESEIPRELKRLIIPVEMVSIPSIPKFEEPKKIVVEKPPVVEIPVTEPVDPATDDMAITRNTFTEVTIPVKYRIKERNDGDVIWWDVLNPDGKIMNETPLDREEALNLVRELRK
jgi:hypothetical protein